MASGSVVRPAIRRQLGERGDHHIGPDHWSDNPSVTIGRGRPYVVTGHNNLITPSTYRIEWIDIAPLTVAKVTGGGQVTLANGGRASFGVVAQRDAPDGPVTGHLDYFDQTSGLRLTGRVADITALDTTGPATMWGSCGANCTFSATVEDKAEPGKNLDTFALTVFGAAPFTVTSRPILNGNIQR
jgi:hypothetical protein